MGSFVGLWVVALGWAAAVPNSGLRSVLMIAVDDLRPQLSVYQEGGPGMHTPNIQKLAGRSVLFERAYVQVALCMPSRTSILTGRRPDTSRSWTIEPDQYWRLSGGNFSTLPQHFRESGFLSLGMGKIVRPRPGPALTVPQFHEANCADQDAELSWDRRSLYPGQAEPGSRGQLGIYDPKGRERALGAVGIAHRFNDTLEPQLQDGNLTGHAIRVIQSMARGGYGADVANKSRPFFLAIGLHKPHVPWWAPARFWRHYPLAQLPAVPHPGLGSQVPAVALQDGHIRQWCTGDQDLAQWCGPTRPLSREFPLDNSSVPADGARYMRQAYFAAVSWTDANIGRILDALDATQFANDTVLALWGDHGWSLGENDQWSKMTNYEQATKIPLMIGCGGSRCKGRSRALVEAIDIMPTLLEEAGLPIQPCPASAAQSRLTRLCSEGRSLSRLLRQPESGQQDRAAYSQFPRPEHPEQAVDLWCVQAGRTDCPNKMGYSIRTDQYRYTRWVGFNKCANASCPAALADWNTVYGEELYNHSCAADRGCPDSFGVETENIAALPTSSAIKSELLARLKAFNTRGI